MLYNEYKDMIDRSIRYIEQHLLEDIRLEHVANHAAVSMFHFHRIFQSIVGMSVTEYIRQRRLTHAGGELARTDKRVLDIAIDYKFGTQEAFSRAFKKMFGMPPKQYRNYYSSFVTVKEEKEMMTKLPQGWIRGGSHPEEYEMGVNTEVVHRGKTSGRIHAGEDASKEGFGSLAQLFKAKHYLGKRIRLSAFVKTDKVAVRAGLWMRVDGPENEVLQLDNMEDRPITGTNDWQLHTVVLDVPKQSAAIAFGVMLTGPGTVWIDEIRLEEVDHKVPSSNMFALDSEEEYELPDGPINLELNP
ncbi:helix-turn-helix transcriptional regulator [Paenibacillus faecalis]|uniref:helix-turn-helix transcriptional regulator n=1 Tax=Paenibacillus faecalis TaxID=2079532 RepID=UPI000D0F02DE|nr:AraC family transcriptional regulator [Paenibacillus faecalis]